MILVGFPEGKGFEDKKGWSLASFPNRATLQGVKIKMIGMATPEDLQGTKELILRDFELQEGDEPIATEEDLLRLLADQIAGMIEYNLEVLLSNLYRLDVQEAKVNYALSPHCPEPANVALARLVLDRQKQRAYTKKHFQQPDLGNLDGLEL